MVKNPPALLIRNKTGGEPAFSPKWDLSRDSNCVIRKLLLPLNVKVVYKTFHPSCSSICSCFNTCTCFFVFSSGSLWKCGVFLFSEHFSALYIAVSVSLCFLTTVSLKVEAAPSACTQSRWTLRVVS